MKIYDVVVVGGGMGGMCAAARLRREQPDLNIALIEPSSVHHYSPLFIFVACGLAPKSMSAKATKDIIPDGCTWIRDVVASIDADQSRIKLSGGELIGYRMLLLSSGLSIDWHSTPGLADALNDRSSQVSTIFDQAHLDKCWNSISTFLGGTMVFSMTSSPIKCPAAPLKFAFLVDDVLRQRGIREVTRMIFVTPYSSLYGYPGFSQTIDTVARQRGIEILFEHEVSKIDLRNQEVMLTPTTENAIVRRVQSIKFDFAHITPRMVSPLFIQESNLHWVDGHFKNWLEVHPLTLQHRRYVNIFGIGDVAGLPTMKSGTAARAQAATAVTNMISLFKHGSGVPLPSQYNGYTSCPIFTGVGEAIQAEIGYEGRLLGSLPMNPFVPRKSVWVFNRYILPRLYWNALVKGFF